MCILAAHGGPLVRRASARRAHTYLAAVPPPESVLESRCLFVPPVFLLLDAACATGLSVRGFRGYGWPRMAGGSAGGLTG